MCTRFATSVPPPDGGRNYSYADYGGGGLFWPYGGSGFFVSGGFVDVIGGGGGFRRCAQMFGHMNTDVQVCASSAGVPEEFPRPLSQYVSSGVAGAYLLHWGIFCRIFFTHIFMRETGLCEQLFFFFFVSCNYFFFPSFFSIIPFFV